MLWRIDESSSQPLFEQVAANVRRALADGSLKTGERLPAASDVAASLGLNVHTVLRAYQQLRDEGVIELRRGRGATVTGDAGIGSLHQNLLHAVDEAKRLGVTPDELIDMIRKAWQ